MILEENMWVDKNKLLPSVIEKFRKLNKPETENQIFINIFELMEISPHNKKVAWHFKCDNEKCQKKYYKSVNNLKFFENGKTYCASCLGKRTNLEKYGVENSLQRPEIEQKRRQTCLERYGCEIASQSEQVKKKSEETCLKKYGCRHILSNKEFRKKLQDDLFEKRGVRINSQLPEAKEQMIKTNREKYGYDYTCQVPKIREKQNKTRMKNRKENKMSSKTERRLNESIFYGKLQKHISRYVLDIYLEIEGIDIEIDGAGHWLNVTAYKKMSREQFDENERIREKFLLDKGIKTIRFIAPHDNFPDDETILDLFNQAKNLLKEYNTVRIYLEEDNRFEYY